MAMPPRSRSDSRQEGPAELLECGAHRSNAADRIGRWRKRRRDGVRTMARPGSATPECWSTASRSMVWARACRSISSVVGETPETGTIGPVATSSRREETMFHETQDFIGCNGRVDRDNAVRLCGGGGGGGSGSGPMTGMPDPEPLDEAILDAMGMGRRRSTRGSQLDTVFQRRQQWCHHRSGGSQCTIDETSGLCFAIQNGTQWSIGLDDDRRLIPDLPSP